MHSERIERYRAFLQSPMWLEDLKPRYEQWLAQDLECLITSETSGGEHRGAIGLMRQLFSWIHRSAKTTDKERGRIKRLRQLLAWPQSEVEQSVIEDQREEEMQKVMERAAHYADHGFHSPLPPPE